MNMVGEFLADMSDRPGQAGSDGHAQAVFD